MSTVCTIEIISQQLDPLQPGILAKKSRKDSIISAIMRYVKEGWPHGKNSKDILHYKSLEDYLATGNACLFLGARLVIPARLTDQVLQLVYLGHFRMQQMKQLACSVVYWPHINEDIEHLCRTCTAFAEHQNKPPKPANYPWMLPEKPWTWLHIDHTSSLWGPTG